MGGANRAAYLMIVGMLFLGLPVVAGEVMLANIHGTTDQAGLQRVDARSQEENGRRMYAHPGGYDFEQICTETRGLGASTIFLVRGTNITEAIKATRWVMTGGRSADDATASDDKNKQANLWVAVYMGVSGSSPPAWALEGVTVATNTVSVRVVRRKGASETKDMHPYWYWVPLNRNETGLYRLELTDAGSREVLLMRRVDVK